MSLKNQMIIIVLCFFLSFFYMRGFILGIKLYQLNKSSYKKRKKKENFKTWLFYLLYKEEIPKALLVLYYFVLFIHPAGLIACIFVSIIVPALDIGGMLATDIAAFDAIWMFVIALLFWSPKREYAYERWITRKRGQKRKKK